MERLGEQGVAYYSNNYLPGNLSRQLPQAGVEWALASYCMGWSLHSSLLVTPWRNAHVGNWSYRPELHTALGTPAGAFESLRLGGSSEVFLRNFSRSVAIVNPGMQPVTVQLDSAFSYASLPPAAMPLDGSELRLDAQSGRVLLRSKKGLSASSSALASPSCKAGCGVSCPGNLCCSLNGIVRPDGSCKCTAPWYGERCEKLRFRPIRRPQGYGMEPSVSSWGGNVLFDGTAFHLYVAAMTNNCSLSSWETNSRIEHAVSKTIDGPYTRSDVAVSTWSHNPVAIRLPGNSTPRYALLHIGAGSGKKDGGVNCNSHHSVLSVHAQLAPAAGATIHVRTLHWSFMMIVLSQ